MNETRKLWRLKKREITPPGGWIWRDEDTGILLRSVNLERLYELVNRHRIQNGLGLVAETLEEFEDKFCRKRVDREYCIIPEGEEVSRKEEDVNLEFLILNSTEASIEAWRREKNVVKSLDKIKEDVRICRQCKHNRALVCISCLGYDTWIYPFVMGLPIVEGLTDLKICEIDKVMLILDIYRGDKLKEKERYEYPAGCWKSSYKQST